MPQVSVGDILGGTNVATNLQQNAQAQSAQADASVALATVQDQINQKKQQVEQQKNEIQQQKFQGAMSTLKTYGSMNPEMQKNFKPAIQQQLNQYGFTSNDGIVQLMNTEGPYKAKINSLLQDSAFLKESHQDLNSLNNLFSDPLKGPQAIDQMIEAQAAFHKTQNQNANAIDVAKAKGAITLEGKRIGAEATTTAATTRADALREVGGQRNARQDESFVNNALTKPAIAKQVTRIGAAEQASELISQIKSGGITDSKNISRQLTNLITSIETGGGGGVSDREAMGVNTLYTKIKGALGYVDGKPEGVIPPEYLDQLDHEVQALSSRNKELYKKLTSNVISGMTGNRKDLAQKRLDDAINQFGMGSPQAAAAAQGAPAPGTPPTPPPASAVSAQDQAFIQQAQKTINPVTKKAYTAQEAADKLAALKGGG